MKSFIFLSILFCAVLFSCEKQLYKRDFDKSYEAFSKFKQENNNTYLYETNFSSWTNYFTQTTIYLREGKIVRRDFIARQGEWKNDKWEFTVLREFTENESEINTQKDVSKALTLDEIYSKAKNELLTVNKNENRIYFETKNNGMISSVGYVPNNCVDDCFIGFTISKIESWK